MGSLEAHERRVDMYSSQPLKQTFQLIKANISDKFSKGVDEYQAQDKGNFEWSHEKRGGASGNNGRGRKQF